MREFRVRAEALVKIVCLLLALLVLHIGGALKHQFIDGQSEFARMGIGRRRQS